MFHLLQNQIDFIEGETVIFQDSLVEGTISVIVEESFNISSNYTFSTGQRKTIYGHILLRRRPSASAPTKIITYLLLLSMILVILVTSQQ